MRPVADWEKSDLAELHRGEIMESLSLEYKDPRVRKQSLSAGRAVQGCLGVRQFRGRHSHLRHEGSGHLPIGTDDGVDPTKIKREWLKNILTANIAPKIEGLDGKPVLLRSKDTGNVAYVLEILQANSRGPHQGPEHEYYKRYNFKAEPMEDYEVRDLTRRGIEYGRWYGVALTLYVEISRICAASGREQSQVVWRCTKSTKR